MRKLIAYPVMLLSGRRDCGLRSALCFDPRRTRITGKDDSSNCISRLVRCLVAYWVADERAHAGFQAKRSVQGGVAWLSWVDADYVVGCTRNSRLAGIHNPDAVGE